MYEVHYPLWTGGTNVFVLFFAVANRLVYVRSPSRFHILSRKTKMANGRFVDFQCALLGFSLLAHIDSPRTLYGRCCRYLGSFAAIQQRAFKEIANRFELLFINTRM